MLKLLNTDCLGNALTKDKASTYNVKFIKNNCCNFNGTSDYICLCADNTVRFEADKIAICFETTTTSYNTIATNLFLDDLNGYGDKIELRNSTTIRWYYNNSCTDYTVPAYNDGKPHELILSKDKTFSLDGINYVGVEETEGYTYRGIYIGVRHSSDYNYYFKGKLWNLRIYKNNILTYHYPMAEGAGLDVYDAKGNYVNLNQTHNIITASESNFWSKTQDEYAYNTLNGFKLLSNGARIPIDAYYWEVEETIYQPIPNGKNYSESSVDFSDLPSFYSTPLSSVKYMEPYVNPDPSMGANTGDGWNITSTQTTMSSKNSWFANTHVVYLKNTENALPEGVAVGLDIKTDGLLSNYPSNVFLYHNASDNPYTHNGNTIPAFFKLKFSFWYKKNEGVTGGALVVGTQYRAWLNLMNVYLDSEWHFVEKEVFVDFTKNTAYRPYYADTQKSIAISWHTAISDTAIYAGTIADFKYTMSQTDQTLSPVYCKIDNDTKSISNILVYDKYQEGLELTRIKNHLK